VTTFQRRCAECVQDTRRALKLSSFQVSQQQEALCSESNSVVSAGFMMW